MNAILPKSDRFGELELIEVFEYYDGPKLFACRNLVGQILFALWNGSDRDNDSYWIVSVSNERFSMIRSGGIGLDRAFLEPELGFVYWCLVTAANGDTRVALILPQQLDRELLPEPGQFLKLKTQTGIHPHYDPPTLGEVFFQFLAICFFIGMVILALAAL
jgi:hypothetical protein